MDTPPANKPAVIKNIYLYLVAFVGLIMVIFSVADLINIALRTYIFTKADANYYGTYYPSPACDPGVTTSSAREKGFGVCITEEQQKKNEEENRTAQRQRDLVRDISLIIVGVPLFLYHWTVIRNKGDLA